MILLLPPAPHTGAFFDTIRAKLDRPSEAATYPGYGDAPAIPNPSIKSYAQSLLPRRPGTTLIGFHTGCLVAIEMTAQDPKLGQLILVDIPLFTPEKRSELAVSMDADDPTKAAFHAAFAYDIDTALTRLDHPTTVIATDSMLFEPTQTASNLIPNATFLPAHHITKPAFERDAMASLLRDHL
jgi:thioesterase domain-containing protein